MKDNMNINYVVRFIAPVHIVLHENM